MVSPLRVSVDAARRLQIEKQGVGAPPKRATKKSIEGVVNRIGCLQIDTINVYERAHYFTLWTRLGSYKKEDLYKLAYEDRRIFEGWGHAMCYMPWDHYRHLNAPRRWRKERRANGEGWYSRVDTEVVDAVLERVKKEGPLGSADFDEKKPSGGWWSWKPTKLALEALFGSGDLMVTRREGFQRIYDLTENVLPGWVDTAEPTEAERRRFFYLRTLRCLGATKPNDINWYYPKQWIRYDVNNKQIQAELDALVEEGEAARLSLEGHKAPYYCLADDVPRLGELERDWGYDGVRIVNYFDSLLWMADRLEDLFGFHRALEVYLKPEQRKYCYYTTPILYGDRLVGRLGPKLERKEHKLIIRGLWYEDGFKPDEEYEDEFAKTLEDFAKFGGADKIEWRCERAPTSSS
jgi:uncharacterized protein YcaQ